MNTPPPLPKPPQAKFSWKHYLGMILVCLFVSSCINLMFVVVTESSRLRIIAIHVTIENLQKQVRLQQEMIDLQWEVIEEMADAEAVTQ